MLEYPASGWGDHGCASPVTGGLPNKRIQLCSSDYSGMDHGKILALGTGFIYLPVRPSELNYLLQIHGSISVVQSS